MDIIPHNNNRNRDFFELYGQCQNRILSFLLIMVHNENDAEDLLQDTAAVMLEKFDHYERGTNFTAWGIAIAKNKAFDFLKKNAKSRPLFRDDLYNRLSELEIQGEETFSDRAIALENCVKQLEDSDQKILQMRYGQDISMKKIAEVLGRSKTGIYQTLARIQSILFRCIKNKIAVEQI